jgi:predicted ribonuclease YlaK
MKSHAFAAHMKLSKGECSKLAELAADLLYLIQGANYFD